MTSGWSNFPAEKKSHEFDTIFKTTDHFHVIFEILPNITLITERCKLTRIGGVFTTSWPLG